MEAGALDSAVRQAWRTLGRFPLVILLSLVGMAAALRLNHLPLSLPDARDLAARVVLVAWIGVPLLFALAVFAEGRRLSRHAAWVLQALVLALLGVYWPSLAGSPFVPRMTRFWLFMISGHLLAALAPALGIGATVLSFCNFNLRILARLGQSLLHAGLLLLGATVALAAVKNLFEIPIPDNVFLDPAIVILGAFHTWYFMSGVPKPDAADLAALEYPRALRRAAQFILMPLMSIYLLILYAYSLKVLVSWHWPTGWATYLVVAFCALGLFTLFLIYPLEEKEPASRGDHWFRIFGRHFYPAMIPLLVLLIAAIGRRVHEYGITENRYLVLALAVWLSGITLHTLVDRRRDIRILPASLCLIALLASFGPWGAFEVSRKSQLARLQGLLEDNGMLVGGKLAKASGPVPREDKREIAGIAEYLEERQRLGDLASWLPTLDDPTRTHPVVWMGSILDNKFALLQALELPYVPPAQGEGSAASGIAFLCRACDNPVKRVTGYDILYVDFRSDALAEAGRDLPATEPNVLPGLRFAFEADSGLLRFSSRDSAVLDLDLGAYFQGLRDRYPDAYDLNLPEEEMILEREADRLKVRLRLRSMRGEMSADAARLRGFAADVFVQVKSRPRRGRP